MSPTDPDATTAPLGTVGVLIAGEERTPGEGYLTRSPYDGSPAAHAHLGGGQRACRWQQAGCGELNPAPA